MDRIDGGNENKYGLISLVLAIIAILIVFILALIVLIIWINNHSMWKSVKTMSKYIGLRSDGSAVVDLVGGTASLYSGSSSTTSTVALNPLPYGVTTWSTYTGASPFTTTFTLSYGSVTFAEPPKVYISVGSATMAGLLWSVKLGTIGKSSVPVTISLYPDGSETTPLVSPSTMTIDWQALALQAPPAKSS